MTELGPSNGESCELRSSSNLDIQGCYPSTFGRQRVVGKEWREGARSGLLQDTISEISELESEGTCDTGLNTPNIGSVKN